LAPGAIGIGTVTDAVPPPEGDAGLSEQAVIATAVHTAATDRAIRRMIMSLQRLHEGMQRVNDFFQEIRPTRDISSRKFGEDAPPNSAT
jgi:hypothetical protein